MNEQEIFEQIKAILVKSFEIEPERIVPEASLFEDFDLDSIDAVDLAVRLQDMTGKRIKPEEFKTVKTVGDLMTAVKRLLS